MTLFCKRHYQAVATAMQEAARQYPANMEMIHAVSGVLAEMFQDDNELFKLELFMQACRPGANVRARKVA